MDDKGPHPAPPPSNMKRKKAAGSRKEKAAQVGKGQTHPGGKAPAPDQKGLAFPRVFRAELVQRRIRIPAQLRNC
jgi:hypothetical protein